MLDFNERFYKKNFTNDDENDTYNFVLTSYKQLQISIKDGIFKSSIVKLVENNTIDTIILEIKPIRYVHELFRFDKFFKSDNFPLREKVIEYFEKYLPSKFI
ncbi:hypothetical protein EZS27_020512 [termite gut metagenome]|uniref:Uncharacterized protein n=1 Tax=termite gut metagenome TaxID=433724 RepID=A0A5J4RBS1_9ZZZZ